MRPTGLYAGLTSQITKKFNKSLPFKFLWCPINKYVHIKIMAYLYFCAYLEFFRDGVESKPWVWLFPLFRTKQQVSCCLLLFHKGASAENETVCQTRAMMEKGFLISTLRCFSFDDEPNVCFEN